MSLSQSLIRYGVVLAALVLGATWAAAANNTPSASGAPEAAVKPALNQFVDAQQLRIDDVVGLSSDESASQAYRSVIAWQVNAGYWNGQHLEGLSLVLVQTTSDDPSAADTAIYISDQATAAQREALLTALSTAHPDLFVPRDTSYRVEPAYIHIEEGANHRVVLHVGTIAGLAVTGKHVA